MKFINIMCTEWWTVCLNWCFNKSAQCESHTPMRTGVGRQMPPERSKLPVTLVFLSFGLARRLAIWNYREGSYHNLVKIKHSIRNINIFTALFIQIIVLHLARLIFLKLATWNYPSCRVWKMLFTPQFVLHRVICCESTGFDTKEVISMKFHFPLFYKSMFSKPSGTIVTLLFNN